MRSHYDTLGVASDASKEDIKKIYRKLVLKFHPDTAQTKSTANDTKFKQISEAYAVLSDDKQRRIFDLERDEFKKFGRIKRKGNNGNGPFGQRQTSGMAYRFHVLDGIYKPKNMIIGLTLGFATAAAVKTLFGVEDEESTMQKNKKEDGKSKLVEAWYNKQTRHWEQPTPWTKSFRDLNPEIQMVQRNLVRPASK